MSRLFLSPFLSAAAPCLFSLLIGGEGYAMHFVRLVRRQQLNACAQKVQPPQNPAQQVQPAGPAAQFDRDLAYYRKMHRPSKHDDPGLRKIGEETVQEIRRMMTTGYYRGNVKAPDADYQKVYVYDTSKNGWGTGILTHGKVKHLSLGHSNGVSARYSFMRRGMVSAGLHYCRKTDGAVAVMNFANAFRTGGDFIGGASAQEETLCRCSSLYASLISRRAERYYYQYNEDNRNNLISERVMVSPDVVFFRYDDDYEWFKRPAVMSVITAAAVDRRSKRNRNAAAEKIDKSMLHLVRNTVKAAADNGIETLVLGAFGCGVFGNDPKAVSRYFRRVLVDEGYDRYFKNIVFAIPDSSHGVSRSMRKFVSAFRRYKVKIRRDETRER